MRVLLVWLCLFQVIWARTPDVQLQVPEQYTQDVNHLADYLVGTANTPRLKAERIYAWIACNINYDLYMLRAKGSLRDCSPTTVLRRRQSVCAGYAGLFEAMARRAGLEVTTIPGVGRSLYGSSAESHAWNAVRLDGEWKLLDCTWGAGFVNNDEFHRSYTDFYFCTDPKQFLTTHFPDDSKWQLVESPISQAEFDQLQPIQAPRLGMGTIVPIRDFTGETAAVLAPPASLGLAYPRKLASFLYRGTRLIKPAEGTLLSGNLEFHLEVPLADRVLVTSGGTSYALVPVSGKPGQFRAMVPISSGPVKVLAEFGSSGRLEPLLEYEAR